MHVALDFIVTNLLVIYYCLEALVLLFIPASWRSKNVKGQTVLITGAGMSKYRLICNVYLQYPSRMHHAATMIGILRCEQQAEIGDSIGKVLTSTLRLHFLCAPLVDDDFTYDINGAAIALAAHTPLQLSINHRRLSLLLADL